MYAYEYEYSRHMNVHKEAGVAAGGTWNDLIAFTHASLVLYTKLPSIHEVIWLIWKKNTTCKLLLLRLFDFLELGIYVWGNVIEVFLPIPRFRNIKVIDTVL